MKIRYLFLGLAVGILSLSFNTVFAKELERQAKIIFVKADVKVQKAGKPEWSFAKVGMLLSDGDTLKTGKASAAELSFDKDNKNIIRLEENSTAILRGKMLKQIELPLGRLRSLVKSLKKESSFEIKTPTVIAGARGSGWDVTAEPNKDTVKAFEDEIFVRSFDEQGKLIKEVYVREGWEVFIERFQAPGELIELMDTDRQDWSGWKEDLNERMQPAKTGTGDNKADEFSNIGQAAQTQEDFRDQTRETQDIKRVEDRVKAENSRTPSARGD